MNEKPEEPPRPIPMNIHSKSGEKTPMLVCPGCSFPNSIEDRFCGRCGAPLGRVKGRGACINNTYQVEQLAGSIPGGWIYYGQDIIHSRAVRIKEYAGGSSLFTEISKKITHVKNLLKSLGIVDFFKEHDTLCLILEPSDSISLEDKIRKRNGKAFPPEEVIPRFREMLNFINHFHSQEIPVLFGDLTPASFAFTSAESIILKDPGLCFLLTKPESIAKFGQNPFAAPEIAKQGDITPNSDLYSIAAITWYLLTDRKPDEESLAVFNIKNNNLPPATPIEFEKLLRKMLEQDPAARPPTVDNVIRNLNKIEKKENPAEIHLNRGIAAFNQGLHDRAMAEFKRASLLDTSWSVPYFWQGLTHEKKGEIHRAIDLFNRTLQLDPKFQSAYYHRGTAHLKTDNPEDALLDLNNALKLNPNDSRAYFTRGLTHKDLKKYPQAVNDFTKAIEQDPVNAESYLWRGLARFESNRIDEAIDDYCISLKLDPKNPFTRLCRGIAWSAKGDKFSALEDINKAIEQNPRYTDAYLERGIILTDLSNWPQALEDLNKALNNDPNHADGLFYRAKVNYRLRNYKETANDLTTFINLIPDEPEAYKLRSDARRRSGDIKGADEDEKTYHTLRVNEPHR